MVEGREDPRCQRGRAAALDEAEHRVEVERTIGRKRSGEVGLDARAQEALLPPPGEVVAGLGGWRAEMILRA